jgi:transcriptional regulator with XRE-family HTH domain
MNWNRRITEAREARSMSKAELARACNVSAPTVTDWESGKIKNLDAANMLTICEVLGVEPRWLVWGFESGKSPNRGDFVPITGEAKKLIQCVMRLDKGGPKVRQTFAYTLGILEIVERLGLVHDADVVAELAEQEQLLALHAEPSRVLKHAPRKHK